MKMLVTGGAGFIGTNLIKRLLKDGHEVVSVDNYSTGKKENHQEGCQYNSFDLSSSHTLGIYVDHGSYPSWRDDEYSTVFHLAALPRVQPSFDNPIKTFNDNVVGTSHILELARKWDIPVVYAGSSSTHGDLYANPYTFTKWQGEEICKMYSKIFDVSTSICRFYNVYGPGQSTEGAYCNVLGIFERQHKNGEPLTITGDGEQRRDFTHVSDIVDGLVKCGDVLLGEGNSVIDGVEFELGRGVNHSINEVADMFGEDYPKEYIPSRLGEYDKTLCEDRKAHKLLGWTPVVDLEDYLSEVVFK